MTDRGREIVWRDQPPEHPDALPLDWEAFWRSRSLPAMPPDADIGVFMSREALDTARNHGRSSLGAEVGGILFGRVYRNAALMAVDVVAAVPAHDAAGTPVHLTFTPQAWDHVFERRAELEEGLEVVGWYHTHPGLGVFLSGTDLKTHADFFGQPWQVAMVLDPVRGDEGVFLGSGEHLPLGAYLRREPVMAPTTPAAAQSAGVEPVITVRRAKPGRGPRHVALWLAGAVGVAAIGLALFGLALGLGRPGRSASGR